MVNVFKGKLSALAHCPGAKFGIVVSRFNEFISSKLLEGAIDALVRCGANDENIDVVWVPGGFEIPAAAKRLADKDIYAAVICLGAIIRGSTPHFEYIASEAAKGIAHVGLGSKAPVLFGVITTDTIEQAVERAGTKSGNKGADAAMAAIEMADLFGRLPAQA